jgi:hypothetical protein
MVFDRSILNFKDFDIHCTVTVGGWLTDGLADELADGLWRDCSNHFFSFWNYKSIYPISKFSGDLVSVFSPTSFSSKGLMDNPIANNVWSEQSMGYTSVVVVFNQTAR